ncbi:hypothetical protein QO002_002011 [Pararhizobium capsulatum DSM 1112]|uniref:Uncharacterized protein n=1 Tax=Pararhizobium capsulatum DSM 1112 TaxID=1121113 RepID=A0ABU0BNP6_9HYPH|nr:hypothetical protein [Pararhizobium capsulatum DSM 1112]
MPKMKAAQEDRDLQQLIRKVGNTVKREEFACRKKYY